MLEQDLRNELNRINGALEVLGLLREKLIIQKDEIGAESAQEAEDEILTQVDAMYLEYQLAGGHDEMLHFVGRNNVGNARRFWLSNDGNIYPALIENMSIKEL